MLELVIEVGKERFDLGATVAWIRPGAVGVRFSTVSEEQRGRLDAIVETLKATR